MYRLSYHNDSPKYGYSESHFFSDEVFKTYDEAFRWAMANHKDARKNFAYAGYEYIHWSKGTIFVREYVRRPYCDLCKHIVDNVGCGKCRDGSNFE